MSEERVTDEAAPMAVAAPSAGGMLRAAREAIGLHIAALAVSMKVPVKKLEALEAGRFDELPDAVFVRALAASMCRALKIDPAPVLSLLPQTAARQLERDNRGINLPFSPSGMMDSSPLRGIVFRPAVLVVAGLLVAALFVAFYPAPDEAEGGPAFEPVPPVATYAEPSAVPDGAASAVPPGLPGTPSAVIPSGAGTPGAPAPEVASVASAANVSAAAASDVVEFKATSSSWIRVSDSQGTVLLEVTLAAGQRTATSAAPPLSIVVGNADATEVLVRGKPLALTEFVKDNVARFEVK